MTTRRPKVAAPEGLLLTHGAGSDKDHAMLVAIEERLAPLPVLRINFPYRDKPGKRPPDRAPVLLASLREQLEAFCERLGTDTSRIVLGGRSMGGRMCTMLAAGGDGLDRVPVAGLIPISYPLHPPGKPEKLRVEHLPRITVPCLFISGERDPFGSPDELRAATAAIAGPVQHHFVPGGHDFKKSDDEVCDVIAEWMRDLGRRRR
ncbi:MAG: alpha/beta family hydrolase [Acidimicrobiales bacterium]